jgi:hypothetical protein
MQPSASVGALLRRAASYRLRHWRKKPVPLPTSADAEGLAQEFVDTVPGCQWQPFVVPPAILDREGLPHWRVAQSPNSVSPR